MGAVVSGFLTELQHWRLKAPLFQAYLEMNYKEAVIAAVKYGETVPVLVNGKQVKISVAEKPKASPSQVTALLSAACACLAIPIHKLTCTRKTVILALVFHVPSYPQWAEMGRKPLLQIPIAA